MSNGAKSVILERLRDTSQEDTILERLKNLKSFSHPYMKSLLGLGDGDSSILGGMFQYLWKEAAPERGPSKK
jgi:hypothetical protein